MHVFAVSFHLFQRVRFADEVVDIEYLELSVYKYTVAYLGARAIHKRRQRLCLFLETRVNKMAD